MADALKKFDIQGIINSVKSMISPEGNIPNVNPDDAIGMKIAQLSTLVQQLANAQAEQVKELTQINKLLNGLFKDIEALRKANAPTSNDAKTADTQTTSTPTDTAQS